MRESVRQWKKEKRTAESMGHGAWGMERGAESFGHCGVKGWKRESGERKKEKGELRREKLINGKLIENGKLRKKKDRAGKEIFSNVEFCQLSG